MSKGRDIQIQFNETMQDLFLDMNSIQEKFKLQRVNSIILLKGLLEEKDSLLYDFLCATSMGGSNPYKRIIQDCDKELKQIKKTEKLDGTEKYFKIAIPEGEDSIDAVLTEEVYNIIANTITDLMKLNSNQEDDSELELDSNKEDDSERNMTICVDTEDLLIGFLEDMPKEPLTILKNNGVYIDGIFEYYNLLEEIYENYKTIEEILKKSLSKNVKVCVLLNETWHEKRPFYVEKIKNKEEILYIDENEVLNKINSLYNSNGDSQNEFEDLLEIGGE